MKKSRLLSCILTLVLVFALMPAMPVSAATPFNGALDFYPGGSVKTDASGYGWSWAKSSRTLTLDGLDQTNSTTGHAIILPPNSKIILKNKNKIKCTQATSSGIEALGNLMVDGSGELDISVEKYYGIYAEYDFTLNDGSFKISASGPNGNGIWTESGNVKIIKGKLDINAGGGGINSGYDTMINGGTINIVTTGSGLSGDDVTINGGNLNIKANNMGIASSETIKINSGKINVTSLFSYAISSNNAEINGADLIINAFNEGLYANNGDVTVNNGSVNIKSKESTGIRADTGNIKINGGTFDITSADWSGIYAQKNISMNGGSGWIRTTNTNPEYTAISSYGTLSSSIPIKGSIDGKNFIIDPQIKKIPIWGDSYSTFVNPSTSKQLKDIQFMRPVSGISALPSKSSVGAQLKLTGTVSPTNATHKTIKYSIVNAGATGAKITGGNLSATKAGTVKVRATVEHGTWFGNHHTKDFSVMVVPKTNKVSKVAAGKKNMKVSWSKAANAKDLTKYEVRYRIKGKAWKVKSFKPSVTSATIKGLKAGKQYQVQVRSYKTVSGVKHTSDWSKVKLSKKIKK